MSCRLMMLVTAAIVIAASIPTHSKEGAIYPMKPIRLIVPSTAGSAPDLIARLLAEPLAKALGQPVVIENKPGASGIIGLQTVASAVPDGYTLGVIAMPYIVTPSLTAKMPYDTERDLAPITLLSWNYPILVVPAASRVHSVADLVALARAKPGVLTYSSQGNGSPGHLGVELFKRQAGVNLTHIPYKGNPAAVAAALAGDVNMLIGGAGALSPHIKSGKFRALATVAPQRMAAYPDLPTFVELGYPGVKFSDWLGIVAPAGTPADVIDRLQSALAAILITPDTKQRLEAIGMEPVGAGAQEFTAFIHGEIQLWSKVIRAAGITAD